MTTSTTRAKLLRVKIERGRSGTYFATSPDVPGFEAVSKDLKDLEERLVPKYLADLYRAAGHPVVVTRLEEYDTEDVLSWVAVPLEVLRQGLEWQMS